MELKKSLMEYPDEIEIRPLAKPLAASVRVPGSKSITNRALVLAALCSGNSAVVLEGCLQSEDTEVMIDGLRRLGFDMDVQIGGELIKVRSSDKARLIPAG